MANKDSLGDRMKQLYECVPRTRLMRRTPVIIRIDGKAFHTFTKKFHKPFDDILMKTMADTTYDLCANIQGCVFGYTQSDEISLLLVDYKKLDSSAWFDNEVQKMCSVSASMATLYFNKWLAYNVSRKDTNINDTAYLDALNKAVNTGAMFDARVFNLPVNEVTNYFYWRQLDAQRNSVQALAQSYYKQKELQGLSTSRLQDKLLNEKGVNWDDLSTTKKRGICVKRDRFGAWTVDVQIPSFKYEGREYIDPLLLPEEE